MAPLQLGDLLLHETAAKPPEMGKILKMPGKPWETWENKTRFF